jgi:NTP pyrophosphatase (non-canonical NTP hydrolase)
MNLADYGEFVGRVTAAPSVDFTEMANRLSELDKARVPVPLLLTAAFGLSAESGEFTEIIKKVMFQGKTYSDETEFHLMRELGDVLFYWMLACRALSVDPITVIEENVRKLSQRYPEGVFSVEKSENRAEGDV